MTHFRGAVLTVLVIAVSLCAAYGSAPPADPAEDEAALLVRDGSLDLAEKGKKWGLKSLGNKLKKMAGFDGMPFNWDKPKEIGRDVMWRVDKTDKLNAERRYKEQFKNLEGESVDRVLLSMLLTANEDAVPVVWYYVKKVFGVTTHVVLKTLFPVITQVHEKTQWAFNMEHQYVSEYNDYLHECSQRKRKAECPAFSPRYGSLEAAYTKNILLEKDREGVKHALRTMMIVAHAMTEDEMNLAMEEARKVQAFFKSHLDRRLATVWYEQKRLLPILRDHEEQTAAKIRAMSEEGHAYITVEAYKEESRVARVAGLDVPEAPAEEIQQRARDWTARDEALRAERLAKLREINENAQPILESLAELEEEASAEGREEARNTKMEAVERARERIEARLDRFRELLGLPEMPDDYDEMFEEVDSITSELAKSIGRTVAYRNTMGDMKQWLEANEDSGHVRAVAARRSMVSDYEGKLADEEEKIKDLVKTLSIYRGQATAERVQYVQGILNAVQRDDDLLIRNEVAALEESTPLCADVLDGFSVITNDVADFKEFKKDRAKTAKDLIDYAQLGMTAVSFGVAVTAAAGGTAAFGAGAAIAPAVVGATTALTGVASGMGKDFITRLERGEASILETAENLLIWLRAVLENPNSMESFAAPASFNDQEACFKSVYTLYDLVIMTLDPGTTLVTQDDINKYARVSPEVQNMQKTLDESAAKAKNKDAASYLLGQGKGVMGKKLPLTGGIKAAGKIGALAEL